MPSLEEAKTEIAEVLTRNASEIKELICLWDKDKNGIISKMEFRMAMRDLLNFKGCYYPREYFDALFDDWDTDGTLHTSPRAGHSMAASGSVPTPTRQDLGISTSQSS